MIDTAELLKPVGGELACGPDLYDLGDSDFAAFEIACQGKAEQVVGDHVTPAEEPDWKEVRDLSLGLFKRNKDLRVAVKLTVATAAIEGVRGLPDAVALIKGLCQDYWEVVYPKLDDDSDPWRLNIVQELDDPESMLRQLRASVFAEARSVGRFTCRDIEVADNVFSPIEGENAPTIDIIVGALRESEPGTAAALIAACEAIEVDLAAIGAAFEGKQGTHPGFANLLKLLRRYKLVAAMANPDANEAGGRESAGEGDDQGSVAGAVSSGSGGPGRLATRADAKRVLEQVCAFLERSDPSNPAPLLVKRAIRLLDMSFLDIINDMAPDAVARIRDLGGISVNSEGDNV